MNQTLFPRRGAYRLEIISAPRGWGTYTGKHPATGENLGVLSGKCLAAVKLSLQDQGRSRQKITSPANFYP